MYSPESIKLLTNIRVMLLEYWNKETNSVRKEEISNKLNKLDVLINYQRDLRKSIEGKIGNA